jgi:DNA-binding MarR family transcriptional regulator
MPKFRNPTNEAVWHELSNRLGQAASTHSLVIHLGIPKSRVVASLRQLAQRGLIEKMADAGDVWVVK